MALSNVRIVSVVLVLLAAGQGTYGACTIGEIIPCIQPYTPLFQEALGQNTSATCDTDRINKTVCCWLRKIVTCLKGTNMDEDTCFPTVVSFIDGSSGISCTVQELSNACPNSPCIAQYGQNCSAENNKADDCKRASSGCAGMSASPILWLTSLMATCLAVLRAARSG